MSADGVRVAKGYVEIGANLDPLTAKTAGGTEPAVECWQKDQFAGWECLPWERHSRALVPSILQASDAAEGFNRFQAVMGEQAGVTDAAWAEMAQRIGRVKTLLRDTASSFQGMFVGLGMNKDDAAKLSTKMTELSLDFASFNNLADPMPVNGSWPGSRAAVRCSTDSASTSKRPALKAQLAKMGITKDAPSCRRQWLAFRSSKIRCSVKEPYETPQTTAGSFANQMKAVSARSKGRAGNRGQS